MAVCVTGFLAATGPANDHALREIARSIRFPDPSRLRESIRQGNVDILRAVHAAGPALVHTLLELGGGILPITHLLPAQTSHLPSLLFPTFSGFLPSMCLQDQNTGEIKTPSDSRMCQQANHVTAGVLLALAKLFQDALSTSALEFAESGTSIRTSISLVLVFYYLSFALHATPSTCNNLGVLLSTLNTTGSAVNEQGHQEWVDGKRLAHAYYQKGLEVDPHHPHLLANLGSLIKDQGRIDEALRLYEKAIELKPDFDIALANIGNTLKDHGRVRDSIPFYHRAVTANPNFADAICGLVSALGAVCDWRGRGSVNADQHLDLQGRLLPKSDATYIGWIDRLVGVCEKQIAAGYVYNVGAVRSHSTLEGWMALIQQCIGPSLSEGQRSRWVSHLRRFYSDFDRTEARVNEGGFIIRLVERLTRAVQQRWYIEVYGQKLHSDGGHIIVPIFNDVSAEAAAEYRRPTIPASMAIAPALSVLPFHTFTYPLSPRVTRLISHRIALYTSHTTLVQSWLPSHVYPPPTPSPKINIGYVSSDFNDHPLAHLMQSVFGFHDLERFNVFLYALVPSDGSSYRTKIEREAQHFMDVSAWTSQQIVEQIVRDGIQIRWCDYLLCDSTVCPPKSSAAEQWWRRSQGVEPRPETEDPSEAQRILNFDVDTDPESLSEDWMYTEKLIYMPHTFFVTDHKQTFGGVHDNNEVVDSVVVWQEEQIRRGHMRHEIFPDLSDDVIIFANFNQVIFATWLRILSQHPKSILWLLRFPGAGEEHLTRTAREWGGLEVAARVRFTDVAAKEEHIKRGRAVDLFLDTIECNAHTVAADILWSGTPILTWPQHKLKMCSRVGASIANATGFGDAMIVENLSEYEGRAISFARSVRYSTVPDSTGRYYRSGSGELVDLRRNLYLNRYRMPLFDTARWTRNIEKAYTEAWSRWVRGTEFMGSTEWIASGGGDSEESSVIWLRDDDPFFL
ncbi:glycosyltransferase family 41 protein [Botryobasidium botryosum FD-172 SS1]|uniref:protein O-GlcNAc transferase n=1 Tax=Botryobasidium botryosum (strain FD-172 SS1) TaxID=930990 RepID=A0A067M7X1_BOTB1|nr:glycosyltransferase family 41 protein [Botryobasidium botryosum FD-172 SS1]